MSSRELTEVLTLLEPKAVAADAEFAGHLNAAWPQAVTRVTIGGGPVPADGPDSRTLDGRTLDGRTLDGPVPPP